MTEMPLPETLHRSSLCPAIVHSAAVILTAKTKVTVIPSTDKKLATRGICLIQRRFYVGNQNGYFITMICSKRILLSEKIETYLWENLLFTILWNNPPPPPP